MRTGYGQGPQMPPIKRDDGPDFEPDGDADDHPKVDHNGHKMGRGGGMCPGCGSKRCMGGCGGGKRM